jgi:hypothetical protein
MHVWRLITIPHLAIFLPPVMNPDPADLVQGLFSNTLALLFMQHKGKFLLEAVSKIEKWFEVKDGAESQPEEYM